MRALLHGLATVLVVATASSAFASPAKIARGERSLARMVDGRVAGQPVSCIDSGRAYMTEIIDKTALVYHMPGGTMYVNRPKVGATTLDHDAIIYTRNKRMKLCHGDGMATLDTGGRGVRGLGALRLGEFVPYEKADR